MADPLDVRCAAASLERDEALHGTASRVRRWLVLEQPGPWGRDVPVDSRLDPEVAHALRSLSQRTGLRVLLVRLRQRRTSSDTTRRAYLAHTGPDRCWIEQLDVEDPRELLGLDLGAVADPDPPGIGSAGPPAVHLVCTNGRHDPCCADLGRPVVRALDDAGVAEVWESSHVGGDRFAANVVCLPLGVYFGRVEPASAARLLDDLAAGMIDLDHYRGRSCFPPLVQSAEVFARRQLGERRVDGLRLTGAQPVAGRPAAELLDVRFDRAGGPPIQARVARERAEEAPMTCHGGSGHPWRYTLVSITAADPAAPGR